MLALRVAGPIHAGLAAMTDTAQHIGRWMDFAFALALAFWCF
jgi:hypothetical protein